MLKWLRRLCYSVLFPARCPGCRRILQEEDCCFCADCEKLLPRTAPRGGELAVPGRPGRYVSAYAAPFFYEGIVRKGFTAFKFRDKPGYAPAFADPMALCWKRAVETSEHGEELRPDLVTWIPVSRERKRERGFDQSELLAKRVAMLLEVPAVALLEKTGNNRPQSSLDSYARAANVIGMYVTREDAPDITGKTVLLIDDILTTGATVREASFVLDGLRPGRIFCLFAAKTDGQRPKDGENFHSPGKKS